MKIVDGLKVHSIQQRSTEFVRSGSSNLKVHSISRFVQQRSISLIESQVKKVSKLRRMCAEKGVNSWIEVDGGVTPANAYKVIKAGANALVVGFAVFGAKDYAAAIQGIKTSNRLKVVAV